MNQLMYFFRFQEDADSLYAFSWQHLFVMLIYIGGLLWFIYYAPRWRGRWTRRLSNPLIWLVAAAFVVEHLWLIVAGAWHVVLPLDWHRLAQVLLFLSLVSRIPQTQKFAAVIGLFTGSAVILLPLPNLYAWPHVTFVTEIVGGIALGWLSLLVILIDQKPWKMSGLFGGIGVIFLYSVWLAIFNIWQQTNYAFLRKPPFWQDQLLAYGELPYISGMILGYIVLFALTYVVAHQLQKHLQ